METPIGKVILRVRGEEFEATIDRIDVKAADLRSPWHKEDELHVWLSFGSPQAKHPGSTLSFGLTLPVKEYKAKELLEAIKQKGEEELERIEVKAREDYVYRKTQDSKQQELDKLANRLANRLKNLLIETSP